jgi:LPXTG-motif cell wall-anchored protein
MFGTKQAKGGIVEAVAAARDEALVEIGREAAVRQELRIAKARRQRTGTLAAAAVAAGAALAAGAVVYRVRKRRNGAPLTNGHPATGNGTVSEHEHLEEHEDEPVASKR